MSRSFILSLCSLMSWMVSGSWRHVVRRLAASLDPQDALSNSLSPSPCHTGTLNAVTLSALYPCCLPHKSIFCNINCSTFSPLFCNITFHIFTILASSLLRVPPMFPAAHLCISRSQVSVQARRSSRCSHAMPGSNSTALLAVTSIIYSVTSGSPTVVVQTDKRQVRILILQAKKLLLLLQASKFIPIIPVTLYISLSLIGQKVFRSCFS